MNKLQETIEKLEADANRTETEEQLLLMLYEAQDALGDEVSDEAAETAVIEARKELLRRLLYRNSFGDEDPVWSAWMEESIGAVRSVFEKMEMNVREYIPQRDVFAFEANVSIQGKRLVMRVYLEEDTRVCRIDADFPFQVEEEFRIPLALKIAEENYPRRFGALQYDTEDGEISYQYTFQISHGIHRDEFKRAFMSVALSAGDSYDAVKRYACGRYNKAEREHLICLAQQLIIELDQ